MTEKKDCLSNDILNYMSDEELEMLIADVEQNELVAAPPDMLDEILERVRESERDANVLVAAENNKNSTSMNSTKSITKILDFRRYCFKVCASVAAAVILVFVLPVMSENSITNTTKQEPFIKESRYATKEEALKDSDNFFDKLGDTNIFSKDREIGIFNGKMEDE